jgi:hypothetical protein
MLKIAIKRDNMTLIMQLQIVYLLQSLHCIHSLHHHQTMKSTFLGVKLSCSSSLLLFLSFLSMLSLNASSCSLSITIPVTYYPADSYYCYYDTSQNNKLLIPSTNPTVGSNGYCEAHSSKWLSASSPESKDKDNKII